MRGRFLHNRVLVRTIAALFHEFGVPFWIEFPVRLSDGIGYVDLYAECGAVRIVCEVELTPDRVPNDVIKAAALRANFLFIVTPTGAVARRVRKQLRFSDTKTLRTYMEICVLPLGAALQRLKNICLLMTALNVPQTTSHQVSNFAVGGVVSRNYRGRQR